MKKVTDNNDLMCNILFYLNVSLLVAYSAYSAYSNTRDCSHCSQFSVSEDQIYNCMNQIDEDLELTDMIRNDL